MGKAPAVVGEDGDPVYGSSLVQCNLPQMAIRCMELNDTVFSRKATMRQPLHTSEGGLSTVQRPNCWREKNVIKEVKLLEEAKASPYLCSPTT